MNNTWFFFTAENQHEIPSNFSDCTYIEYLSINNCGLAQLPHGLEKCHSLHSVVLSENQLESICEGVFSNENMPRLERLDLDGNRLRELPADIWQLNSLIFLDVNRNPLRSLGKRIHLPNLQHFLLEEIETEQLRLPDDCYLPNIESFEWRIWLDNSILPKGFSQSHRLREIKIYESALCQIDALSQLKSLHHITITNARLIEFPLLPSSVEEIDFSGNPIHTIPPHIGELKALKRLRLDQHRLQEVPAELGTLTALESLQLHGEPIKYFPVCFSKLMHLNYLHLRLMPNAVIDTSFTQLPALKTLMLEGGMLTSLAVWHLPNLETMHWQCCNIDSQVFATERAFPKLSKLIIKDWQAVGIVDFSHLSALKILHISHAIIQIGNLPKGLESFTYWYSRTPMQQWLKLPDNIYTLCNLKKIVLHKNALSFEEQERLQQHCIQKGINLKLYLL